jgi:hypothetical protein
MAPQTPDGVPTVLVAGFSWRWRIADLADYPQSESWALKYQLLGVQNLAITGTWQTSGDDLHHWLIAVATTDTDNLTSAEPDGSAFRLIGYVEGSGTYAGRVERISDDTVTVYQNPLTSTAGDFQPFWESLRLALKTSITTHLSDEKLIEQYGVAGRQVARMPWDKRLAIYSQLEAQHQRQKTGRFGQSVAGVFQRAS